MSSSWWQRALSEEPQPKPVPPQQQAPLPYQPQYPQQQPQQPAYPPTQQAPAKQVIKTKDEAHAALLTEANYEGLVTRSQKAGDTENCPNCGSHLFFHRLGDNPRPMVNVNTGQTITPTPSCQSCGYPTSHHLNPPGT